ncbi:mechanosensitive ion channel [Chitinibacter sp. SCUT-21]|uniref:mechanosensitive ion channel domain-containing protein n=1 Tax=Chitinibacter sp. SCUT-21 TaxID=2970891 RepID=UPI0035A6343C
MLQRLFALSVLLCCLQAHAISIPGFSGSSISAETSAEPTASSNNSLDEKMTLIRQKLEHAQTLYEQLKQSDKDSDPLIYNRLYLYEIQMTAYRQHLAALTGQKAQEGLAQKQAPVETIASSVLAINQQRQSLQTNQLAVRNLMALLETQEGLLTEQQDVLADSQAQLRRKSETLEQAKPENRAAALKDVQLAQLQVETRTAVLKSMEERQKYTRAQLQFSREQQEALVLALKDQPLQPKLNDSEFKQVQAQIEKQRQRISSQIARLSDMKQEWLKQVDELSAQRQALLAEKEQLAKKSASRVTTRSEDDINTELNEVTKLEQINYLRLENNSLSIGILLDVLNGYTLEHAFWQMYFNISQNINQVDLNDFQRNTLKWDVHLSTISSEVQQAITVAQMQAQQLEDQDELSLVERKLWQERAEVLSEAAAELSRLRLLIQRWGEQFNVKKTDQSVQERAGLWKERLQKNIDAFWHYELFSVADTLQVDGQVVSISRGVTVGKLVFAILLMLIGFFLILKLAHWFEAYLIRRFNYQAIVVRIAKRWILAVAFIILLINSLLLVRIPLTVFAFMGGAIAIGLGFGMQTLLKNLISGLMMILERPFKPGDTVEVGNLRGTVVDMSVRAAVIRDINGIETLVPNSTFLEQNVTNWTYSSNLVRQSVKVGVAYGSDVRLVSKLLAEDIERHGQICKEPHYEILLEDFGADALMFGVHYWIDITAGTLGRQVASDLRFMIEASLRKNHIEIAFPQRDVHVDIAQPIELRIQRNQNNAQ